MQPNQCAPRLRRHSTFAGLSAFALLALSAGTVFVSPLHAAEAPGDGVGALLRDAGNQAALRRGAVLTGGGDGGGSIVIAPGGQAAAAPTQPVARVVVGGGGVRADPWAGGEPPVVTSEGVEAATRVPGVLHVIQNVIGSWLSNAGRLPDGDALPNPMYSSFGVKLTALVAIDAATRKKIADLCAGAAPKIQAIALKHAKVLEAAYLQRIHAARELLTPDDQKFLDVLMTAWKGMDAACAKVTETDPRKRLTLCAAARAGFLKEFAASMDAAQRARLFAVIGRRANVGGDYMQPDGDLAVYFGLAKLSWEVLFTVSDQDRAKLRDLTAAYVKARAAEHLDLMVDIDAVNAGVRAAAIALLPAGPNRADLEKIADWYKQHSAEMADLADNTSLGIIIHFDPNEDPKERRAELDARQKHYQQNAERLHKLDEEYQAAWPDVFQTRVKELVKVYNQGGRPALDKAMQRPPAPEQPDEF